MDQLAEQFKQVVLRITAELELIAGRAAIVKLERFEADKRAQQARLKVKSVGLAGAIRDFNGLQTNVFEIDQSLPLRYLGVEASRAKPLITTVG